LKGKGHLEMREEKNRLEFAEKFYRGGLSQKKLRRTKEGAEPTAGIAARKEKKISTGGKKIGGDARFPRPLSRRCVVAE